MALRVSGEGALGISGCWVLEAGVSEDSESKGSRA